MTVNRRIREVVREALAHKGWTQTDLARHAGIRQATVSRVLSGAQTGKAETWERILDALELELTVKPKGA